MPVVPTCSLYLLLTKNVYTDSFCFLIFKLFKELNNLQIKKTHKFHSDFSFLPFGFNLWFLV